VKAKVPVSTGAVAMLRSGLKCVLYCTETLFPSVYDVGMERPLLTCSQEKRDGHCESKEGNDNCKRPEVCTPRLFVRGHVGQVLQPRVRGYGKDAGH